jgi:two-component system CheB/CheR fusion protein
MIIDDLLDLSRLNTGKLTLNRTALHARPVIDRIVEAVRLEAGSKRIEMSVDLDDLVIYADSVRLEQIVWNLVSNAVKFTPPGGRITVRFERDGPCARLKVSDNGQGMDANLLQHMFDMFVQGEEPVVTRRGGGLGIGLALVKQLAQLHDGRVEAHSSGRGKGSTLCVWLPLFEGQLGGRIEGSSAPLYAVRILLVEDDTETLRVLSEVLDTQGAHVTAVDNAKEALRLADTGTFDLVVSDIGMPEVDGLQMIAELRRRERSARWPAIAVSGFGQGTDRDRAKAAGFDDHLTKPLSIEALLKAYSRLSSKST